MCESTGGISGLMFSAIRGVVVDAHFHLKRFVRSDKSKTCAAAAP
jgi:hypothetical protein